MKKIVSLFMFALILLSTSCFAETADTQTILFRDIEWGSSMPTVFSALSEVSFSKPSDDYAGNIEYYIFEDGDIEFSDYVCAKVHSRSLNEMNVAGYELSNITLHFAYTPDDTGLLPKDEEHTALVLGEYTIKPKDLDFVMNDLLQKLTKVYGEPFDHRTNGFTITHEIYAWAGADDTIVSLIGESYSSGSTNIYIRYSFYGADDYYQQAMDALVLEELMKTDTNDVTGL